MSLGVEPFERVPIAEEAARSLAREIEAGRLVDPLPSSRNLAVLLKVSRPTVLEALRLLEKRGMIRRSGPRLPYRLTESRPPDGAFGMVPGRERKALFLLDQEVVRHSAFELQLSLATRLHKRGWGISALRLNFGHGDARHRQWRRAIEGYAPDKVIVWSGRPKLAEWLCQEGLPTLFIGGDFGGAPIACIGVSASQAVGRILDEFFDQGHERIWFPLCDRPKGYAERLHRSVEAAFAARGVGFHAHLNAPVSPYRGPEIIAAMFETAWNAFQPTALMFHDWREYLAVSAELRKRALDIPGEVSVALIGEDPEMAWHRPPLAHFRSPAGRIASACVKWLLTDAPPAEPLTRTFLAEWVAGGTISAPRKRGAR